MACKCRIRTVQGRLRPIRTPELITPIRIPLASIYLHVSSRATLPLQYFSSRHPCSVDLAHPRLSVRAREECPMTVSFLFLRTGAPNRIFTRQMRCLHPFALRRPTAQRPLWSKQIRGKKTIKAAKLDELPQGVIPLEPLPLEYDVPQYPTVLRQAKSNMQKFENCVLLTRVGGFYELYFEHADEFGPLLNVKVGKKTTRSGDVSMVISLPYSRLLC